MCDGSRPAPLADDWVPVQLGGEEGEGWSEAWEVWEHPPPPSKASMGRSCKRFGRGPRADGLVPRERLRNRRSGIFDAIGDRAPLKLL
jgi:hypothetical protein